MRTALVFAGLVVALAVPNAAIVQKERLLANGTVMLLELAPVDPRSLIQGDYMALAYAIGRDLQGSDRWPRDGRLVVAVDSAGVARFVRRHDPARPLAAGEHLLRYRLRNGSVQVGTDAFHFQEGRAEHFARARYGEMRVDRNGTSVLVGMRDEARRRL